MKTTSDMDFDEFCCWATGYILFGIGEGRNLKSLVWSVIQQALQNKIFGNAKNTG